MRLVSVLIAGVVTLGLLIPASLNAQMPSIGSMVPDKSALLQQAKKLVTDLTAMKQDPSLSPTDKGKVDALLPKATEVNSELEKGQTEPSQLAQLAGKLGDLQKQAGALKAGK